MPSRRHVSAFAVLALGGLLLTGCASISTSSEGASESEGSGSDSSSTDMNTATDQTVAEACKELQEGLSASTSALQNSMTQLSTDPNAAAAELDAFIEEFAAVRDGLGNAEVKAAADSAGAAYEELVAQAKSVAADPASVDQTAFMETMDNVQTELSAVGELCAAG
jgi:hypothetical protein